MILWPMLSQPGKRQKFKIDGHGAWRLKSWFGSLATGPAPWLPNLGNEQFSVSISASVGVDYKINLHSPIPYAQHHPSAQLQTVGGVD
jgi:hypothetical protein